MLLSAGIFVLLAIWAGPQVEGKDQIVGYKEMNQLYASFKQVDMTYGMVATEIERSKKTYKRWDDAMAREKTFSRMISTQDETLKSARREIGRLDPQMIVMTEDFDNLNSNVTQEFGNLHSVSEHIDEELGTIEADTQTYAVTFEQSMADINQAIEDQKRSIPVLMLQEADRQAQVRDDFRREIAEYESAREQETTSREELMQTVDSTIAALRARDQASHDRAASLQIRVQQLIQEVEGIFIRSREQGSRLDTANASFSGDRQHVTNFRTSFNTHLQQFNHIQQMLATIQASVAELQTRKGQVQGYTSHLNEHIQDRQSRLDDDDQQRATLLQQIRDLRNDHGQDNNAKDLRLNDVEATLDNLAADTAVTDTATQVETTLRNLQTNIIPELSSKVDQNQNMQDSIQQQQSSQQQSIQSENADVQAFSQGLQAFNHQIESLENTHQMQISNTEARLLAMETQANTADSDSSDTLTALQNMINVLSEHVDIAEEQFDQYPNPSAISDSATSVGQAIQGVEDTQATLTAVEQQLTDSMSETDGRFNELETSVAEQQDSLQQAQANLQLTAQSLNAASVVSSSIANLETQIDETTEGSVTLVQYQQGVNTDHQRVQTIQAAIQQQIAAIPDDEVQQTLAVAIGEGTEEMTNQLNDMGTSVDALKAMALAISTSSEITLETLQDALNAINTEIYSHEIEIDELESSLEGTEGLEEAVLNMDENVAGITSDTTIMSNDISSIEQALQSTSFDYFESGSYYLAWRYQTDWWGIRSDHPYSNMQTRDIRFNNGFRRNPIIYTTITKLDMNKGKTNRLKVYVEDVTPNGFRLNFGPWSDTILYEGNVDWIAIGTKAT
ncbi:kinesin-like protein KIF15 [Branchiostoma floridae]|uniref:Kinesin-like protein KIF15 n=1 Tax=Branchiostoma floridae TaxID=7739 RepID=A0A9J7KFJ0_BRAFL|nr:kinesin-like protein KIF15 [Branchiostoma floridae]